MRMRTREENVCKMLMASERALGAQSFSLLAQKSQTSTALTSSKFSSARSAMASVLVFLSWKYSSNTVCHTAASPSAMGEGVVASAREEATGLMRPPLQGCESMI